MVGTLLSNLCQFYDLYYDDAGSRRRKSVLLQVARQVGKEEARLWECFKGRT